ncbi:unnamed protein product, partial [Iphiclides podalirius]
MSRAYFAAFDTGIEKIVLTSNESIRAIRKENVDLKEEVRAMSHLCAALYEQRLAAALRLQFKDDIIREMRRQLRSAKAKRKGQGIEDTAQRKGQGIEDTAPDPRGQEAVGIFKLLEVTKSMNGSVALERQEGAGVRRLLRPRRRDAPDAEWPNRSPDPSPDGSVSLQLD